jgi:hypothetical protein
MNRFVDVHRFSDNAKNPLGVLNLTGNESVAGAFTCKHDLFPGCPAHAAVSAWAFSRAK